MKCEKCGNEIPDGQLVCLICGAEVPKKQKTAEEATADEEQKPQEEKPKSIKAKKDYSVLLLAFGLLISLVLTVILGVLFYYRVYTTPKTIFMNSLDVMYDEALLPISSVQSNGEYNIRYTSNKQIDSFDEIMTFLSNISFETDMNVDYTTSELSGSLTLKYGNQIWFDNNIYGKEKSVYIMDEKLNQYVEMENKYRDFYDVDSKKVKAYKTVLKEIRTALRVALKEEYFKSYKETLNVNGTDETVYKNELIINNDNIKVIEQNIVKYLYNSKKYISSVAKLKSVKSETIKKQLDKKLTGLNYQNTTVTIDPILIDIYTKGFKNEFVKLSLKKGFNFEEVLSFSKIQNNEYKINIELNDKSIDMSINKIVVPEKTSYIINYYNGFESAQFTLEYSLEHNKKYKKPEIQNPINYSQIDDNFKKVIKKHIMDEDVNNIFTNDKKDFKDWIQETIELFNPTINVVKDEEENTSDGSVEEENYNPTNEGSVQGLGDESIDQ